MQGLHRDKLAQVAVPTLRWLPEMSVGTDAGAEVAVPTLRWHPEMPVGTAAGVEVAVPTLRWRPEMSVGTAHWGLLVTIWPTLGSLCEHILLQKPAL